MTQKFSEVPGEYAVVRLESDSRIPDWALSTGAFGSVSRTDDELSIVCLSSQVPDGMKAERDWRCLKLHGPFAFNEVGVLSSIAKPLAEAGVGIFAISTFDTDYVLVKHHQFALAIESLVAAGHSFVASHSPGHPQPG